MYEMERQGIGKLSIHQLARENNHELLAKILQSPWVTENHVNQLDSNGMSPLHYTARHLHIKSANVIVDSGKADIGCLDSNGNIPLILCVKRKVVNSDEEKALESLIHLLSSGGRINVGDSCGSTALHVAAMRGNITACEILMHVNGADVNVRDNTGATALHKCATYNQLLVAKFLIVSGAEVTDVDYRGCTPLHLAAAEQRSVKLVMFLFSCVLKGDLHGFINMKDNDENTALHKAIDARNTAVVKLLLERGAEMNVQCRTSSSACSPLHIAAITGDVAIISLLLIYRADELSKDAMGSIPLHYAAEYQNEDAVEELVLKKRSVFVENIKQETPLLTACHHENGRIVEILLNAGSDILKSDYLERNAIMIASYFDQPSVLEILLEHTSQDVRTEVINAQDQYGNTALHTACKFGFINIVKTLLHYKADNTVKNEEEETPFLTASRYGHVEVVEQLLMLSEKILNDQDENCNTALHLAALYGHKDVVNVLIESGADKEARNNHRQTILDCASMKGHVHIVEILLNTGLSTNNLDNEKTPPLFLAALHGHEDVVSLLIDSGSDLSWTDSQNRNFLEIAIEQGHREVILAIINSNIWKKAFLHERQTLDCSRVTPLRLLIKKYPDLAKQVFDRCIEKADTDLSISSPKFELIFDFTLLDDSYVVYDVSSVRGTSTSNKEQGSIETQIRMKLGKLISPNPYTEDIQELKENHPLMIMVDKQRDALLHHPLILLAASHKWSVVRPLYFLFLLYLVINVMMITSFMLVATPPFGIAQEFNVTTHERILQTIIIVMSVIGIISEVIQIVLQRFLYLQFLNLADWTAYILAIFLCWEISDNGARTDLQWQCGAFCLLLSWTNLLLFMRRMPLVGLYIVMITEILITFSNFFVAFFLIIIAFSLSFHVLLSNQTVFSSVHESVLKTLVTMLGEMDYGDIFYAEDPEAPHYFDVTYIIFMVFLIVLAIVLTNLLIGLAVDDVNALHRHASLRMLAIQLELTFDVEFSLPHSIRRKYPFSILKKTIYPNEGSGKIKMMLMKLIDGPVLHWKTIIQAIKTRDEKGPSEFDDLDEKLTALAKTSMTRLSALQLQMNRIEEMLSNVMRAEQSNVSVSPTHSRILGRRTKLKEKYTN